MSAPELIMRHVNLDKDDWEWFKEKFGGSIGYSKALRLLMKEFRAPGRTFVSVLDKYVIEGEE